MNDSGRVRAAVVVIACALVAITQISTIISTIRINRLEVRVKLLEAQLEESHVEDIFLARKLEESRVSTDSRLTMQECQTDLAVAGFRMGHWQAARFRLQGGFQSCNTVREAYDAADE